MSKKMKHLVFVFVVAFAFSTTAMAIEIAISTQAGWFGQAAADREMQEIVDNVTAVSVEVFTPADLDALAGWVADHTGDGLPDLLIMCGNFPDTIYTAGNAQPDGSLAELFLDDGNTIINTGDYMFYVGTSGNNDAGGLQNMMDIPGITMWDDDTAVVVNADGEEFTPTLVDYQTDRPFHLDQLEGDWKAELILAQNDAGTRAEPVIVVNIETGGRLGIFYQTSGQDDDPRGKVISDWINNWYIPNISGGGGNPFARRPDPEDGALHADTWISLSWRAGYYAVSHDAYISDNFDDVNSGAESAFAGNLGMANLVAGFPGFPLSDGLVPGTTYYWRIDEVNEAEPNSPWKGGVWSFWIPPKTAYNAIPSDGAKFVDPNADLSWTAGLNAKLHTVYFGDNFDDVNNAAGGLLQGITTYALDTLELEKTYFWRVDESDPPATHKGDVWSFKTLPDIVITDPSLVGWWKLDEGGTIAVDWSGHGNHGTLQGDPQWVAGHNGDALDFDGSGDWVTTDIMPADFGLDGSNPKTVTAWVYTRGFNDGGIYDMGSQSNGQEFCLRTMTTVNDWRIQCWGFSEGFDHDFTYPTLGTWVHFAHVYDGTSTTLYANGEQADFYTKTLDTANAAFVIGRYGSGTGFNGIIDDLRLFNKALTQAEVKETMRGDPLLAWDSKPSQGSTLYIRDATPLSWSPGDNASQHDVYFGTDKDAVANADESDTSGIYRGRQGATNHTPSEGVEWGGGPYYWRIDEFNTDGTISKGNVWSFTIADFIVIDDFESYNDLDPDDPDSNRIFNAWLDGFDNPAINGSTVGHLDPPFAEQTIVHGGGQSMPFAYDNGVGKSEATLTLTDTRDWTQEGVGVLSIWFQGDATNANETMYVVLNGSAAVTNDNANAAQATAWTEWTIDLQEFGINLANVNTITLGFGNRNNPVAGGAGMMFFDDIRLYAPAP